MTSSMSKTRLYCTGPQAAEGLLYDPMLLDAEGLRTALEEASAAVESEQYVLRQLIDCHERERQHIAYAFHDRFAQQLTGALMNLQAYGPVARANPSAAEEMLTQAAALVSASIDDVRRLISRLRPPVLDESGIVVALEYLACDKDVSEGPPIELWCDVHFERLIPPLETALFRIAQEAVANARQHSGAAQRIRIELSDREDRVILAIRDWGVGFDPSQVGRDRFGLENMRHRARLLGGRTTITSEPGEGTLVTAELPLVRAANGHPLDTPEI